MFLSLNILLAVIASLRSYSLGEELGSFVKRNKFAIENYVMTGSEGALRTCDILSLGTDYLSEDSSQWNMKLWFLPKLDIRTLATTSSCLIISSRVNDYETLSALVKFGFMVTSHKRLGMALSLGNGIFLEVLKDTPNFPFMMAATSDYGYERFLCPVVGERLPKIQSKMCDNSFSTVEGKILQAGFAGFWPYVFWSGSEARLIGADVMLMDILQQKMNFNYDIADSFFNHPVPEIIGKVRINE